MNSGGKGVERSNLKRETERVVWSDMKKQDNMAKKKAEDR